MKRKVELVLVTAAMMAVIAGCSGKTDETAAVAKESQDETVVETEAASQEDITLNVALALAEEEWAVMRNDVFPKFTEKTGIQVNGIQVEHADMENKVDSLVQAGKSEIDIVAPDNMLLSGLVEKGLVKDLSAYENLIPEEIPENLYEGFRIDGKLYYMPYKANVKLAFYDSEKFEEYGITPPSNWDELKEMAKTFYEAEGVGRFIYQGSQGAPATTTIFEMIRAAGGDPLVLNDEGSVETFKFLQEIWPYTNSEVVRANFASINQMLASGTAYYGENWPFCANVVVKESGKENIKAYPGPEGPAGMSKVLGGSMMAVVANTEHEDACIQFIEFIMSREAQEIFTSKNGWSPIRPDALGAIEEWQKPFMEAINEAMQYAEPRPIVPYWSDVDKAINDAYNEIVVNGNENIQEVLDKYHADIEAAKERRSSK